jgi:hypothetical protein
MDLTTILSSGVVAGLVAGLVTLRTTERKIAIENITQQRKLWRDKVREKSLEVAKGYKNNDASKLKELYGEFQLILNPEDDNDKSILDTLWQMQNEHKEKDLIIEFTEKLALLLKHDWERAKLEAKPVWHFWGKPKRIPYNKFKNKRDAKNS